MDEQVGALPGEPEDVWRHVRPVGVLVDEWRGSPIVVLEAACGWEVEHGLCMVWLDGSELIKVGPFDGHYDNMAWAQGPEHELVVHEALSPGFSTRRDGS